MSNWGDRSSNQLITKEECFDRDKLENMGNCRRVCVVIRFLPSNFGRVVVRKALLEQLKLCFEGCVGFAQWKEVGQILVRGSVSKMSRKKGERPVPGALLHQGA